MTALFAGLVTFAFTTILTVAGVGAAFILIPVFLALGIEVIPPWPLRCCSTRWR